MQDEEKLDPEEMFKNLSIDEPFLYLGRESREALNHSATMIKYLTIMHLTLGMICFLNISQASGYLKPTFLIIGLLCMTNFIKGISVIKHLGENVNKLSVIGITKKWIYCKPGFPAGKTEKQFQIKEIDDIIIKQYKHSRKHNYGNILFVLKSGKKIKLYGINDPHRFRSEIEKLMQPEESPASDAS